MSATALILFNALFVGGVVAGLVYVCRVPYRLGRSSTAPPPATELGPEQEAQEQVAA